MMTNAKMCLGVALLALLADTLAWASMGEEVGDLAGGQEDGSCGSSCVTAVAQSSSLLQVVDRAKLQRAALAKMGSSRNHSIVVPEMAVCINDMNCETESCQIEGFTHGCSNRMCRQQSDDPQCANAEDGTIYEGMQESTYCWSGKKTGLCQSMHEHLDSHEAATQQQAVCHTKDNCREDKCLLEGGSYGCWGYQCYKKAPDQPCEGIANGQRYEGMQPGTWCHNQRKNSRCSSDWLEGNNLSLAPKSQALCYTDADCQTESCNGEGLVLHGCSNGLCKHGHADAICGSTRRRNGRRYIGMPANTYCWDGRIDGYCNSTYVENSHPNVTKRAAVCHDSGDCDSETCNTDFLGNLGCVSGKCRVGKQHNSCGRRRSYFRYANMQENTWCQHGKKEGYCNSTRAETPHAALPARRAVCKDTSECETESCQKPGLSHACEAKECRQKVVDPNCNGVRNHRAYDGMQPGTWCYSGKKYGRCATSRVESNHTGASRKDSMCQTDAECQTDSCLQADWAVQGRCHHGECRHANPDEMCNSVGRYRQYSGMQPETWCYDGKKYGRCLSSLDTKPNFPVLPEQANCTNTYDCASRGCNQGGLRNLGCRAERCTHGFKDPECYGIRNGEHYNGQQEDTWCHSHEKLSFCKAREPDEVAEAPPPPPTTPAPTPAPLSSAATRGEAACMSSDDCQSKECTQPGFVVHGCVAGVCHHFVDDPSCKNKGAGARYENMQEGTWCDHGYKESLCKSRYDAGHVITMAGCPRESVGIYPTQCTAKNNTLGFSCCSSDSSGWKISFSPCPLEAKTFEEAKAECASRRLHICGAENIGTNSHCDTDCRFGHSRVWTDTPCDPREADEADDADETLEGEGG